jgi:hypothetical protein
VARGILSAHRREPPEWERERLVPAEVELAFVDSAEQFDASDHCRRRREPFETEHRTDAEFHAPVILLYY